MLVQETTTVLLVKDTGESPRSVLEGLHVHDLDQQDVAWLGAFDLEGPGEVVDLCQVDVAHVVCTVVVLDLAAGPGSVSAGWR